MSCPKNHTYRPLPKGLKIKDSKIEGQGLFAVENFNRHHCFGITHVEAKGFDNDLIRTPLGAWLNHSDEPNCFLVEVTPGRWHIIAEDDIYENTELTVDYKETPCMNPTTCES